MCARSIANNQHVREADGMQENGFTHTDPVTGALARAGFEARLAERVDECRRLRLPCSLVVFDVDHFKSINDAFGHARGDDALAEVARRARGLIRAADALFRYGGDEFVLLLPGVDHARAMELAQRLLHAMRREPVLPDIPLSVTLSMGVATFPDDADSDATLFERADARNYAAKRQGRDRAVGEESANVDALPFHSLSRLVERDDELLELSAFIERLREHARAVLTIGGVQGAGRTALLNEAARRARQTGMTVIELRCTPRLKSQPHGALALALPALRRELSPSATPSAADVAARIENYLAENLRAEVLFTVDDAQHLDWSTRQVLRELIGTAGLAVVGLVMVGDPEATPYRAPHMSGIVARPLPAEALRVWLRMLLRWEPPADFIDWVARETQGAPRQVERLLTHLHGAGLLARRQERWFLHPDHRTVGGEGGAGSRWQPPAARHNLPAPLTSFIGRESELANVHQALARHRLVTLTGAGGTGKTRLSIEVANDLIEAHRDGVWLVELAAIRAGESEEDLVVQAIADTLGFRARGDAPRLASLTAWLATREVLLVLDNCEHLIAPVARAVSVILAACAGVRILASSREALGIAGEFAWRVPSLPTPAAADASPGALARFAAVRLFVERAAQVQSGFALGAANARHVAQIVQRLDGIPLAIELAAARMRSLRAEQIAERLDDSFRLLTDGNRGALPRHQTLRSLIDWSHGLLTDPERRLLRRLSVFAGSWSLEAAEASLAGEGLAAEDILNLLTRLVDKSLVVMEERNEWPRYRLLETIRQYAREHLVASGESEYSRNRHLEVMTAWAETTEPAVGAHDQQRWLAQLDEDVGNFREALRWAELRDAGRFLRLASALWRFWDLRGHAREGLDWLARALALQGDARTVLRARGLARAGYLARNLEDYRAAAEFGQQAMQLARQVEDAAALAMALFVKGASDLEFSRPDMALPALNEALHLFRQTGQHGFAGTTLIFLGFEAEQRNDLVAAREHMTQGLAEARRSGDARRIAHGLVRLGFVATAAGDARRAGDLYEEALRFAQRIGDKAYISNCIFLLGRTALFLDDTARAAALLESPVLVGEGAAAAERAWAHIERAKVAWADGDTNRCVAEAQRALDIGRASASEEQMASALVLLAQAARTAPAAGDARGLLAEAVRRFGISRKEGYCLCLDVAAMMAVQDGRMTRGARLLAARERLRAARFALDHYPFMRRQRTACEATARAALGAERFDAAWHEGLALTEEEAMHEAMAD
ncbi:MAG: diguanylate cyclase [Burkholderiales bacterium]|nr:diguanylate cyclase [Burkholderiales bacterium]